LELLDEGGGFGGSKSTSGLALIEAHRPAGVAEVGVACVLQQLE